MNQIKCLLLLVLIFSISKSFAADKTFEFHFWTSPSTKSDKRVSEISDHPCGSVAVANVTRLPKYSKSGTLIPEPVYEINPLTDKILRQWSMPVDGYVLAIQGSAIYIGYYQKTYRIDLHGRVTQVESVENSLLPNEVQCKTKNPLFPSKNLECLSYKDLRTGKPRILSYEMVCS